MAISLRACGSWAADNTTTMVVPLPTHVAGDMLIVRFACKPYTAAISVTTGGWNPVGDGYSNGSTANGNGVGSVRIRAYYKIATSDAETDPTVDWNGTSNPGMGVALSYQKGAAEVWDTPVGAGGGDDTLRTSQTCTIGSHISVVAGDMVDFFLAWGDNYASTVPTITQTGVTYATVSEQPATALSTAVGFDGAADGGYRLATAGTSSAAAVVTATFDNSEQGGAWQTRLRVAATAPQLVTPGLVALTLTKYEPTVTATAHQFVTPGPVALTLTRLVPTVTASDHKTVTPGAVALTLTTYAPVITASDNITVTPGAVALTLSPLVPVVSVSDHQTVTPGPVAITATLYEPTVTVTEHQTVTPDAASVTLTAVAPIVTASDHKTVTPTAASIVLTAFAPNITVTDHITVTPTAASLVMAMFAPTVTAAAGDDQVTTPGTVALTLTTFAPIVSVTAGGDKVRAFLGPRPRDIYLY